MDRIHVGMGGIITSTWLAMAPIPEEIQGIASIAFLISLVVSLSALRKCSFSERTQITWYSLFIGGTGFILFGLAEYPTTRSAEAVGNAISNPWTVPLYNAIAFGGIIFIVASVLLNLLETRELVNSPDEGPPGPEDL